MMLSPDGVSVDGGAGVVFPPQAAIAATQHMTRMSRSMEGTALGYIRAPDADDHHNRLGRNRRAVRLAVARPSADVAAGACLRVGVHVPRRVRAGSHRSNDPIRRPAGRTDS